MCYFCHWGWPKPIADIYKRALDALNGYDEPLKFGPAHIVWEDCNFDSDQWCLDNFDDWVAACNKGRFSDAELEIVRRSLVELVTVPDEYKTPPCDEDTDDISKFPPPDHWEVVRAN